ncbi:MAG: foldase protein PrsA [Acidimicrobiales bacterium]
MNRRLATLVAVSALLALGCSGGDGDRSVATVDGVVIDEQRFNQLHVDTEALSEDDRAGSVLILILQRAFSAEAEAGLGLSPDAAAIDQAYDALLEPLTARGDLDQVLTALNETEDRIRINAELDVMQNTIADHLVRNEIGGFDLDQAERTFALENAEVCTRQIQFDDAEAVQSALSRLDGGEPFESVARDLSIDPFVGRGEGVGAGGDLGCSTPSALPAGLDEAAIDSPLGQAVGPVASSVGVHVFEVYDRSLPDVEARHNEVIEAAVPIQGPELFRRWAVDVLLAIEVDVDEDYGRWGVLPETEPVPTVVSPSRFGDINDG